MRRIDDFLGGLFGLGVVLPMIASALAGVLVIIIQCLNWLKTAVWETPTIHNAIEWLAGKPTDEVRSGLRGLDEIIHWALDTAPLSLWLILVIPLIWLAISMPVFSLVFALLARLFAPLPPR
jgi:hypothetical protein